MRLRPPPRAADPFMRHTVKTVCRGASGVYEDTLEVAALHGATPTNAAGSPLQPAAGNALTVIVRVADWRAEFPPALGATFESDSLTRCTVQHVQRVADRWHLACVQNQKARAR